MVKKARHEEGPSSRITMTRPWFITLAILVLVTLFLEFFFDLRKHPLLYLVVSLLDLALLMSFFYIVWQKIRQRKSGILDLIRAHKGDVAYVILVLSCSFLPRIAAGLVMVRFVIGMLMRLLESKLGNKLLSYLNLRPSQTLALSFIGLIGAGTILLTFPAATTDGKGATFINALFTMTSASCVAGLIVHDIGEYFTGFGQAVIVFGMQAGGLGIMFLSAAFAVMVGGAAAGGRQKGFREVLDVTTPDGLKSLIRGVTGTTVMMEFFGVVSLFFLTADEVPKASDRLWWSVFHTVSAFCNAGVPLSPASLTMFVDDTLVCIVFMILITSGGIGFFVMSDLRDPEVWRVKKPLAVWGRLQMQTKVVLVANLILDILGTLLFLFFEYDGALRGLAAENKIVASLFHAVSLRSAGFNIVPLGGIAGATVIFSIAFMFIGASPGSCGGGIKTTTAAVSVMALRTMLRGREDVELFGRKIESSVVSRSLSIVLVAAMIVAIFLTLLLATQEIRFENLFFETVSAFGTVGLSMDTTGLLNNTGKILIVFVMYIGRIGPLTLALAIGERKVSQKYQLPKGSIAVG